MPWKDDKERKEKQHQYYLKNQKRIRARVKAWREADPDYKEKAQRYSTTQKARRKALVESIKGKLFCMECGESRNVCLDFHHRDPNEKEGKISAMLRTCSIKKILEEIEKCDVLCANCHRVYHSQEE